MTEKYGARFLRAHFLIIIIKPVLLSAIPDLSYAIFEQIN